MKKEMAVELIKDFHERDLPETVNRDLSVKLPRANKAVTIIGPRRAGKTYFLFDYMKRLDGVNHTEQLYVNLEDDRLLPFELEDMDRLLRTYYEIYPANKKRTVYLYLDEIQNVNGWERFVRRVLDTENARVFLTGSSSKLLSREIATAMRGRSVTYLILPFSFKELLGARGVEAEVYMSSEKKAWILNYMDEFLRWGGFPEVVLDNDETSKSKTIKEYVEVMLMRDVVERHGIKNIKVLRMLFNALLASNASEFSIHKFFNFLKSQGIKVSKNTLYDYFQHFEDAFAILPVRRFSHSMRQVEQSLPKVYQIDTGYASRLGMRHSDDMGKLMENMVAVELLRRASRNPLLEFYYWKDGTGKEVDFLLKEGNIIRELVQVCYDVDDRDTKSRETRALIKASKELGCKNLRIITWDMTGTEAVGGLKITYTPAWKWLLGMG